MIVNKHYYKKKVLQTCNISLCLLTLTQNESYILSKDLHEKEFYKMSAL